MGSQLKKLVPCLLLLAIISLSHVKAKPCKCPDSGQDQVGRNRTFDSFKSSYVTYYYAGDQGIGLWPDRGYFPDSGANNTMVLCTIKQAIQIWGYRPNQQILVDYDEASFSATIVYHPLRNQSVSGVAFIILPYDSSEDAVLLTMLDLTNSTSGSAYIYGHTSVSVVIGAIPSGAWSESYGQAMVVNITIYPSAPTAGASNYYTVWIDYDRVGRRLSVYVELEGKPKPENPIAEVHKSIRSVVSPTPTIKFGLLTTVAQLLHMGDHGWTVTVSDLPDYFVPNNLVPNNLPTILSSVFGSIAATAVVATAVACYFNSKYRRWHKDLDQIARSIERLPGVPTNMDFTDIKKATGNFHETMKLGGGGFGTVYRCTLPAAAAKTEQPMDVAVKRFTHDLPNRRYDDFLAEVSIINRLRHKNIVPLVGWSYNKGEPLLIFEYMTNGSLDQHLFSKGAGSGSTRQRRADATILRWTTRYEIVMNIATGLHYVHHEYEPMVLHRDIKVSNIMLDSSFHARLGDFGIACTVAIDRNSATGLAGTWGYIAPEYAMCGKATRQTDIYALGVLILEIVTGQRALANHQVMDDDDIHITDRVWRFHREGILTECVDAALIIPSSPEEDEQLYAGGEAERLLLLGLACSNPNPSDRPAMPDVVRVIAKSAPPPEVPLHKPRFIWPPREDGHLVGLYHDSAGTSMMSYLDKSTMSTGEMEEPVGLGQPAVQTRTARRHASFQLDQSV